tara:strand:+ start:1028 stop:1318 length:291 start_codon:yes stop_codon:yes gene_type:complete
MNNISIEELVKEKDIQIIDVREEYEHDNGCIGSINIPMGKVLDSIHKIDKTKKVVIYCQTGKRASAVVYMLRNKYSLKNILNLTGGYEAYLNYKST